MSAAQQKIKQVEESLERAWDDFTAASIRTARGTVAGLIGGVVAAWVMNRYQEIESRPVNVRREEAQHAASAPVQSKGEKPQPKEDDATVKTAQAISTRLLQHDLSPTEKEFAGPAVHYSYGAAVGALYGGLSELIPTVGIGLGIPYATILFLAGDEVAVPTLGLGKPPTQAPPAAHISGLASHFVYGITLDITRRIVRRLI